MLLRRSFTNLHFDGTMVADSLFQAIFMVQIEHFITGKNPYVHAKKKKKNYTDCHFLPSCLKRKKRKKEKKTQKRMYSIIINAIDIDTLC
jgi:hypothetical protein